MSFDYRHITFAFALFIVAGQATPAFGAHALVEVFEIHYSDASKMVNVVEALLSAEGKISVAETSNSLIVRDYPKNIAEVKKLLARIDKKPSTIVINVKFVEEEEAREVLAGLSFKISGPGWSVATDSAKGADGVAVSLKASVDTLKSTKTQFIRILENRKGKIFYGEEHPVTNVQRHVYPGGEVVSRDTSFKKAGTSISVTARKVEKGKIMVSLTPQTGKYNKEDGTYSTKSASTTVVVDDPGTIVIGGLDGAESSSTAGIPVGVGSKKRTSSSVMILSVKSEK